MWYYLALGHSESIIDQEEALAKVANLVVELRSGEWKACQGGIKAMLSHCIRFYSCIDKFGRFPHRNSILGRESTEEEKVFLEQGGVHGHTQ